MKSHLLNFGSLSGESQLKGFHVRLPKIILIFSFGEAIILFFCSFILFFIDRTAGPDPRLLSGAYSGTVQLTYFVCINIAAILFALKGFSMYRYIGSGGNINEENRFVARYMISAEVFSLLLFALILWGIFYFTA
jgi:hypothetical protein